eukprot:TRINITY_DN1962_c0_g1_i1.p1 TRINITY_DN1962_c0_g1~~TRINITY_DN1962_c0_g1_i1.p1  ORF type:complete len:432 (-),score=75.85 TRINITY_DN1962_c0_g1_i1:195-1490(-)
MKFTEAECELMRQSRLRVTDISDAFLAAMPKADLHIHLDGSMRLQTLIDLAREQNVELPAYTREGLRAALLPDQYASLAEYLLPFHYLCAVLCKPEALERVAYELAIENYEENVFYTEPRFCPQLHSIGDFGLIDVIESVDRGMRRAQEEVNQREEVKLGQKPRLEYGLLICALRKFDENVAKYFRDFIQLHKGLNPARIYQTAAVICAQSAIDAWKRGCRVVGFDIAGEESTSPAEQFQEAFELVHQHLLKKTVHAGEADGPNSIYQAIVNCHADRIGHGLHLFDTDWVRSSKGTTLFGAEALVKKLVEHVASKRICIEACITSNWQTHPELAASKSHPITNMLKHDLCVTLCCDNKLVSHTTLQKEYRTAVSHFGLNACQVRELVLNAFRSSFFHGTYHEKLEYYRSIEDYYTRIEAEFGIIGTPEVPI